MLKYQIQKLVKICWLLNRNMLAFDFNLRVRQANPEIIIYGQFQNETDLF
jgi:hypothetical protein